MSDKLKNWLSQSDISVDLFGRVIIENETIIDEINGSMGDMLVNDLGDRLCGAGCDQGCVECVVGI